MPIGSNVKVVSESSAIRARDASKRTPAFERRILPHQPRHSSAGHGPGPPPNMPRPMISAPEVGQRILDRRACSRSLRSRPARAPARSSAPRRPIVQAVAALSEGILEALLRAGHVAMVRTVMSARTLLMAVLASQPRNSSLKPARCSRARACRARRARSAPRPSRGRAGGGPAAARPRASKSAGPAPASAARRPRSRGRRRRLLGDGGHVERRPAAGLVRVEDHDRELWTPREVAGVPGFRRRDPEELPVIHRGVPDRRDPRQPAGVGRTERHVAVRVDDRPRERAEILLLRHGISLLLEGRVRAKTAGRAPSHRTRSVRGGRTR